MKIVVRSPNWLGDCVMSTVFLNRLKDRFKEASITVLTKPVFKPLFESHPAVTNVIESLENQSFDKAFVLPRSFRSAWEIFKARVPERVGYSGELRWFLLSQSLAFDPTLHTMNRYLKLIDQEKEDLKNQKPFFPKKELSQPEQETLFGKLLSQLKQPFVGLGPASQAPARTWDSERFLELAQAIQQEWGGTVFLFGSPNETPITGSIKKKMKGSCFDLAGKLDFPQLGGMMNQLSLLVSNESGLMHVASAFSIPNIVLCGASDPRFTTPPYPQVDVIQHTDIPCVPCVRNHCPRFGKYYKECLSSISVSEVMQRVGRKLKKGLVSA